MDVKQREKIEFCFSTLIGGGNIAGGRGGGRGGGVGGGGGWSIDTIYLIALYNVRFNETAGGGAN